MSPLHPALTRLLELRYAGRLGALLRNFTHPRRLAVSILGTLLALVWLGNAVAGVLFREQYDPEAFRDWLTLSFTGYALWHFVRVAWQRPEHGLEWTDAEANALMAYPFTRRELVSYRLMTVLIATTLKATIGTILLLPDLPVPLLGFVAMWLGLGFIELIRIACDMWASSLEPKLFRLYRGAVVTAFAVPAVVLLVQAVRSTQHSADNIEIPVFVLFLKSLMSVIRASIDTPLGMVLTAPFSLFVVPVTARELSPAVMAHFVGGMALIWLTERLVLGLDHRGERLRHDREKRAPVLDDAADRSDRGRSERRSLPGGMLLRLAGPVVWRQCVGVRRYLGGVLMALLPPAILAAMPLYMERLDDTWGFANFLGALTFYTFVLLPAALKFDFRKDYDHLLRLKLLPFSPLRIVVGQMLVPVVITTLFQYAMLVLACFVRPVNPWIALAAVIAFPSLNFAIYAWENLLFLLFPQRLKQEGIEVFLQTTIKFTAKGLMFAMMFVLVLLWVGISASVAELGPAAWEATIRKVLFWSGMWLAMSGAGVLLTSMAAKRFAALDGLSEGSV